MRKSQIPYLVTYPVAKVLLPIGIGILVSRVISFEQNWVNTLIIFDSALLVFLIFFFKKLSENNIFILISFLLLSVGFVKSESIQNDVSEQSKRLAEIGLLSDSLEVFGTVESSKSTNYSINTVLEIDSIKNSNVLLYKGEARIQLVQFHSESNPTQFKFSDKIQITATHKPIRERRNPNQFDYEAYLLSNGIVAQFQIQEVKSTEEAKGFAHLKNKFKSTIESMFSTEHVGIAKALILGDKSEISPEARQEFTRSGLAHLMAVSGLHVGFILAPFWYLIPLFWLSRGGRVAGIVLLALILLFYCWLTGFSPSVVRASIMAFLFSYAKLFDKIRYPMNIVGVAACILLLYNPNYLFDVGFQLSFGAVSIILMLLPMLKMESVSGIKGAILSSILVGIVVQIGLAPLLVYYFGELSIISPISNLLAIIPAYPMVLLGLVGTLLGTLFPILVPLFGLVLNFFAGLLSHCATFFSSTSYSYAQLTQPDGFFLVFWVVLVITIIQSRNKVWRWKWFILLLLTLFVWRWNKTTDLFKQKTLELTVFDVGQGDANLIQTPNGKSILIDTGVWSPNSNSGTRVLLPELKARQITVIDAIVLSHPHADHIGGTLEVMDAFEVKKIYTDTLSEDKSNLFERIIEKANQKQIPISPLLAGNNFDLDENLSILVLWPLKNFKSTNLNEQSTVLRIDYGKTSFLFTGDGEDEAEEWMSTYYDEVLDTDYLKIGHHGSKSSSHQPFLSDNTPEYASVSLGLVNKYKHPHAESMIRLNTFTKRVHFTSLEGAAIYRSNGDFIEKLSWLK